MTSTEWITDIALILVVFRQLWEGRLDLKTFLIPLGIVAFVAHSYLGSVPTAGNDLVLIGVLMSVGAALGVAGGVYTLWVPESVSPGLTCWFEFPRSQVAADCSGAACESW